MLLLKQSAQLRASYRLLRNIACAFRQLCWPIVIVLVFNYVWCVNAAIPNAQSVGQALLQSVAHAVLMLQKGFDLHTQLNMENTNLVSVGSMQDAIYYVMVSIPLNGCCIAFMLKQLLVDQHNQQQIKVSQYIQQSLKGLAAKEAQQLHQKQTIKQHILALQPIINPISRLELSYFLKLCNHPYFSHTKIIVCVVSTIMLLAISILNQSASEPLIYRLKICRLFFFVAQLLVFLLEGVAFRGSSPHFTVTLLIYIVTIPGHFIMLVPVHKIYGGQSLKAVLSLFVSLPPLTFINLYLYLKSRSTAAGWPWSIKMRNSIYFMIWFFLLSWLFAAILASCVEQNFGTLMVYLWIGLLGGNYSSALDINQLAA